MVVRGLVCGGRSSLWKVESEKATCSTIRMTTGVTNKGAVHKRARLNQVRIIKEAREAQLMLVGQAPGDELASKPTQRG